MKVEMKASSYLLLDILSSGLYDDVGQQESELLRNGGLACMPDPKVWEPQKARLEISLVTNHPLANRSTALVFLDYGSGITDPGFERYFRWVGTPHKYVNQSSIGAAQKGVGRFAAAALNEKCRTGTYETRRENGYYILTRTSKSGQVRFVPVIFKMADEGGFEIDRWIDPTSTEMGPLKGIIGSFTAIVIPNPVFKNHEEIYESVKWFLPREKDKMFNLKIGGKQVEPPLLENTLNKTSMDGEYRARIGVANGNNPGIWLCDSTTGLRVANCQRLGPKLLPEPIWLPGLTGDIFMPGLLASQDSSRSTLHKDFTRKTNKDWQKGIMFLLREVVPDAQTLIDRDPISGDAAKTLDELVEMFRDRYGDPPGKERKPPGPRPDNPPPGAPKKPGGGEHDPSKRYIRVRDEVFILYRGRSLDDFRFAQVNPDNRNMIYVNVRGNYKALPSESKAKREHCLMQILQAIGEALTMEDPLAYANEIRSEFLKK